MSLTSASIAQFEYVPGVENLGPRWRAWVDRLEQYFTAAGITDDAKKKATLLFLAGESVSNLHLTLKDEAIPQNANIQDTDTYGQAKYRLNQFFQPKRNKIIERFNFRQAKQEPTETIYQFVSRLRVLAEHCEFGNTKDDWIISQVVQACNSEALRREYLKKADISYADLLSMGRSHDNVEDQARQIEGKIDIKQEPVFNIRSQKNNSSKNTMTNTKSSPNGANRVRSSTCFKCGGQYPHPQDKTCPAIGKKCYKCGTDNHLASVCRKAKQAEGKKVNQISEKSKSSDDKSSKILNDIDRCLNRDSLFSIKNDDIVYPRIALQIANTSVNIHIDTMSSINVIDEVTFKLFNPPSKLKEHSKPAFPYGTNKPIKFLGEFLAPVRVANKHVRAIFVVAEGNFGSLLGYPTAKKLGVDPVSQILYSAGDSVTAIVNKEESEASTKQLAIYQAKYPTVFSGKIGQVKGVEVSLHINDTVKPVQARPRNIPYHLREAVEKDIQYKLDNDIIEAVENEPTTWLNETVPRQKPNGDVRICLDMRAANEAITCEKYQMPNVEDILFKINGMKYFTKLDLNKAFEQVTLHKNSRYISRFRTPRGIFQYKRLFFGLSSAPEIFNNLIRRILEGISNHLYTYFSGF